MTDIFISYSRADLDFVQRLHSALVQRDKDVWVDWEDIPPSADWLRMIKDAIRTSDSLVFVISPASIASRVCRVELEYALSLNKRVIPVLRSEVDSSSLPQALAAHNWIRARDYDDFEAAVRDVIHAVEVDPEWLSAHTRVLVRAMEWEASGRDISFLLRGNDLIAAEAWLAEGDAQRVPHPTEVQTAYVIAARLAATRSTRQRMAALTIGFFVSLVLLVFALLQREAALEQQRRAEEQARIAFSRELAAASSAQLATDPELSVILAIEGLERATTAEATASLRRALEASRIRIVLRGHQSAVWSIAVSPDGRQLASGDAVGSIRLWDAATGEAIDVVTAHSDEVYSLAFSPDGTELASGGRDSTVRIFDLADAEGGVTLEHPNSVPSLDFSPDGTFIATACMDGVIRIWDPSGGPPLAALVGHTDGVSAVDVSPSGLQLATGSADDSARIWDIATGDVLHTLRGHEDDISDIAYNAAGSLVATASSDDSVRVWDARSGEEVARLEGHLQGVTAVSFSADGERLVTSSIDDTVRVWDLNTRQVVFVLVGHNDVVQDVIFSEDERHVISAGEDGTLRVWHALAPGAIAELPGSVGAWKSDAEAILEDGTRIVTGDVHGYVRVWDTQTGTLVLEARAHEGAIRDVAAEAEGHLFITASADGTAKVWDNASGRLVAELPGHPDQVMRASLSADGSIALTGSGDPQGGSGRGTWLWDTASGDLRREIISEEITTARAISPNGAKAIVATESGDVSIWETSGSAEPVELLGHQPDLPVFAAAFSTDGTLAITGSEDDTARIWNVDAGTAASVLAGHTDAVSSVAVSPNGTQAATGSFDHDARIWEVPSGRLLHVLDGHAAAIAYVTFSPDGNWLLTSAIDGTARVWDARTGAQMAIYEHGGFAGQFSPDGQRIIVGTEEDRTWLYACEPCLDVERLVELARSRVTRPLNPRERSQFLHESD